MCLGIEFRATAEDREYRLLGLMRDALVLQRLDWSTTTSPSRPRSMRPLLHCCAMEVF